ncbi:hypothetical protein GQ53DRAFT_859303 [Thozetella sp. PMI_491]|nr:hypothetical protein GQ53DRAFT_859303 [Thozetella sp. PMI_491]
MRALTSLILLAVCAKVMSAQNATNSTRPAMYPLSTDPQFSFNLAEFMALTYGGGAATGEILRAATQVVAGDFESYYREFKFLADSIHKVGVSTKYPISRRDAFFRSATYYRAADFFLHGNWSDPRINALWESQLADYDAAIALLPVAGERFTVHSDGFDTISIFYAAQPRGDGSCAPERRPTLLVGSGYDGAQEEVYHALGRQVLDRGWNFATDVDTNRIALQGMSYGGTLAPRAATREPRLAAVIAIDGLIDFQSALIQQLGPDLQKLYQSGNKTAFDYVMNGVRTNTSMPSAVRWYIDQGLWAFNTHSPFDWVTGLGKIVLTQDIVANISCPVFVGCG